MAENSDPQTVKWANERARVLADSLTRLFWQIQSYAMDWQASGLAAKITAADPTQLIADGSDVDGRQRIHGQQLLDFAVAAMALVAAGQVPISNGQPTPIQVAALIQVNGSPR